MHCGAGVGLIAETVGININIIRSVFFDMDRVVVCHLLNGSFSTLEAGDGRLGRALDVADTLPKVRHRLLYLLAGSVQKRTR